jgi:hypothetical protein
LHSWNADHKVVILNLSLVSPLIAHASLACAFFLRVAGAIDRHGICRTVMSLRAWIPA